MKQSARRLPFKMRRRQLYACHTTGDCPGAQQVCASGYCETCAESYFGGPPTDGFVCSGINDAISVTVGTNFACALRRGNAGVKRSVWCWGYNAKNQMGNAAAPSPTSATPTAVSLPPL